MTSEDKEINKIAVLGLGNILLRDEGIGVKVVEELNDKYSFSPPVKIIDGGTLGFSLINEIAGCKKLIVIDAVKADEKPGTIYRFKQADISYQIPYQMSAHDVGFIEALEQWKILGVAPDVLFIGIEPEDIEPWGFELSDCIKSKMSKIIKLVIDELEGEGITVCKKDY